MNHYPRFFAFVSRFIISIIILFAVLKTLAYALTPLLSSYRESISQQFSNAIGMPVHISKIEARWRRNGPALWLHNATLGENAELKLGNVFVDLDLFNIFTGKSTNLLRVHLKKTQLRLVRDKNQQILLAGLNGGSTDTETPLTLDNLNFSGQILIDNADLIWEDRYKVKPAHYIGNGDLAIKFSEDNVRIAALLSSNAQNIRFTGSLDKTIEKQWTGEGYLSFDNVDLVPWLAILPQQQHQVNRGKLNMESWLTWSRENGFNAQGSFYIHKFDAENTQQQNFPFNDLYSHFVFNKKNHKSQLELRHLSTGEVTHHELVNIITLSIDTIDNRQHHMKGYVSNLSLANSNNILHYFAPKMADFKLQGELKNTRFKVITDDLLPVHWTVNSQLKKLNIDNNNAAFSIHNIGGDLSANNNLITLDLQGQNSRITLPELFRHALEFDQLTGKLSWSHSGSEGWVLQSNQLTAINSHIETESRIYLKAKPGQSLFTDIQTDFRNGKAENTYRYLPTGIMNKNLVAWLDEAVTNGSVPQGSFLLYGPMDDFPFSKKNTGHFEVNFDSKHDSIIYGDGWPPLTNIRANTRFHNNALSIALHSVKLYNNRAKNSRIFIPQLDPTKPMRLSGTFKGPADDLLRYIKTTPLNDYTGDIAKLFKVKGKVSTDFSLTLPFETDNGQTPEGQIKGKITLNNNELAIEGSDLTLKKLQGKLRFDNQSLKANNLKTEILGQSATLNLQTVNDLVKIAGQTTLDLDQLKQQFPDFKPLPVSGKTSATVKLDIRATQNAAEQQIKLAIESDLAGAHLDLPKPFNKTAVDKTPFALNFDFNDRPTLKLDYKNAFSLIFTKELEQDLHNASGYKITMETGHFPVIKWLDVIKPLLPDTSAGKLPTIHTDLTFGSLDIGTIVIDNARIKAAYNENHWQGNIKSDTLAGNFFVPGDVTQSIAKLRLDKLNLVFEPGTDETTKIHKAVNKTAANISIDPRLLPAMELTCDNLIVNDKLKGKLEILASRQSDGLKIQKIDFHGKTLELKAQGLWSQEAQGAKTHLTGTIKTPSLEKVSDQLGFEPQFQKAPANSSFDLTWAGSPLQYTPAAVDGNINIDIGSGQLVEIKPGALRIFGLLNFDALQRRLKLDFSDVAKKGFGFDTINGSFVVDQGSAYSNDLAIDGPSAEISISGRTGLADRDFDQIISVKPAVDTTLVIAGALAGGPVGGILGYLAQKVVSGKINKVNRFQYSLKGSWENPTIEKLAEAKTKESETNLLDQP